LSLITVPVNPAHGTQGYFNTTSFDKKFLALQFAINPLYSSFSLLLHTRTFFATPLAEKMHLLLSACHQSENPFPAFFFVANFYSSLINMPIIHIEEFETSLLTLFGVSLVLWRRKADSALSNPCFMTLPPNFTTSEFPISNYFTFQNFC
jgi:hypothetical protein